MIFGHDALVGRSSYPWINALRELMPDSPRQIYALTLRKAHTFMLARGVSATDLLANTDITEAQLQDPYHIIHRDQARNYYRNVVRLADSPGIGLEIGWTTSLTAQGALGTSQLSARTVEEALSLSYSNRFLYDLLVPWTVRVSGDKLIISSFPDESDPALRVFLAERGMGSIQAGAEELVGPDAAPISVMVDFPAPTYIRRYEEIFRCPVYFRQKSIEMHYPRRYLEVAIPTHDAQLHSVIAPLQETLLNKLRNRSDVVRDVRHELRRKPGYFPSIERVAERLAMSSRTLRRRLGQQDVTFQQLLDAERRTVAQDYLVSSSMTIQQIAEHCGFQDAQNFSQAFKRWVGVSPSEYRNSKRRP